MKKEIDLFTASFFTQFKMYFKWLLPYIVMASIIGFCLWLPKDIVITITLRGEDIIQTTETFTIQDTVAMSSIMPSIKIKTEMAKKKNVVKETKPAKKKTVKRIEPTGFGYYAIESFEPKNESESNTVSYINRFYKVAIAEQTKFGIPASVTLAQGILESGKGKSALAIKSNNHFGIKCFGKSCEKGHCVNHADDTPKDMFRVFPNAWYSYRAHSKLLMKTRYDPCRKLKTYNAWCDCLKAKGYATDPSYASKLKKIIRDFRLNEFDDL